MTIESAAFCTANVTSLDDEGWLSRPKKKQLDESWETHDTYFNGMPNIVGPLSWPASFPDEVSGCLRANAFAGRLNGVSFWDLVSVGGRIEGYGR